MAELNEVSLDRIYELSKVIDRVRRLLYTNPDSKLYIKDIRNLMKIEDLKTHSRNILILTEMLRLETDLNVIKKGRRIEITLSKEIITQLI